jgi:hypothetical protein
MKISQTMGVIIRLLLAMLMIGLGYEAESAHAGEAAVTLRVVAAETSVGKELVTLEFSAPVKIQRSFLLHYPERVVVDMDTVVNGGVAVPASYRGNVIKGMRFAQNNPTTSRLVIEVTQPLRGVSVHEFSADGKAPLKMVVDMALSDEAIEQQQISKAGDSLPLKEVQKQQSQGRAISAQDAVPVATMSPKTASFERKVMHAEVQRSASDNGKKPFLSWYKPSVPLVKPQDERNNVSQSIAAKASQPRDGVSGDHSVIKYGAS